MTKKTATGREVTYLPLADLEDDPRNPKDHDLETIKASIQRFGVVDAIVQDQRTGRIVSGHGRKQALESLELNGEPRPEGVQTDDDGTWLVPVVTGWKSDNENEASAAIIAMNRTTELGGWVDEDLLALLDDLGEDAALDDLGFTDADLINLHQQLDTAATETAFEDLYDDDHSAELQDDDAGIQDDSELQFVEFKMTVTREEQRIIIAWINDLKDHYEADTFAQAVIQHIEDQD